jgi:hypothetical protein
VSLLIPSLPGVALAIGPQRTSTVVPSVQLAILPLVSSFLALVGWAAGLYFYRWERRQVLSVVIWVSGALSSLIFLIAALFIVSTTV